MRYADPIIGAGEASRKQKTKILPFLIGRVFWISRGVFFVAEDYQRNITWTGFDE